MKIKVIVGDITKIRASAIIVNLFEGVKHPSGTTKAVDQALDGTISRLISQGEIKGKLSEVTVIHTLRRIEPERVVVVGLGKEQQFNLDRIRGAMAEACRSLRKLGAEQIATIVYGAGVGGIAPEKTAQAIVEGSILGLYTFNKHKTKEPELREIEELLIVERDETKIHNLEQGVHKGKVLAEATCLARDLINQPANYMTPSDMVTAAQEVAAAWGLELEVLEQDEMEQLGMGALLGVAQGSRQPAKFIILSYRGAPSTKSTLGFIGKGVTFDSGGISIKPSERMGDMKGDMAGGATVIAALRAIAELKPKLNVTALIPATENLPSGTALKPGDVLKAMNGKTIEIVSTDAEGRLILADALCYAKKLGLSPLVDVATLTGACHIALGDICSGAFTNNQKFIDKVTKAGEESGERIWQMPMYEEYKEQNKSEVADIKNSGGRYGGAITAAQFLAEFAEDTPWGHLDIAGTSMAEKERNYLVKGATGVAVRTLVNLALALAEK
jgi:leucyl aminopeptidase